MMAVYRSEGSTVDARVTNISQGGLNLRCRADDVVGTSGEIQIILPGDSCPLRLAGKVVWRQPVDGELSIGFCFDQMKRECRLALANFIIVRSCAG